jgi:uncharacterized protein YecE (DUF72 family)
MTRLLLGTSGYAYKPWKGPFYPKDLPEKRMLAYYAERFPTVEINSSFYQMPRAATLEAWAAEVPPGFQLAFKAPGRITHQKRLEEVEEAVGHLWKTLEGLGDRLGPLLYGLPPNMKKDVERLEALLALTPPGRRVALEVRHETWLADDVYEALRAAGAALCVADAEELSTPVVATAGWGYLRLRKDGYDDAALAAWAGQIEASGWSEAYVYFKHEDEGAAPKLAARLGQIAGQPAG